MSNYKSSLKYLGLTVLAGTIALYANTHIDEYVDCMKHIETLGQCTDYKWWWGTLGTDFFGAYASMGGGHILLNSLVKINNKISSVKVDFYGIYFSPLILSAYFTLEESLGIVGWESNFTHGGFSLVDTLLYWTAAAAIISVGKKLLT